MTDFFYESKVLTLYKNYGKHLANNLLFFKYLMWYDIATFFCTYIKSTQYNVPCSLIKKEEAETVVYLRTAFPSAFRSR